MLQVVLLGNQHGAVDLRKTIQSVPTTQTTEMTAGQKNTSLSPAGCSTKHRPVVTSAQARGQCSYTFFVFVMTMIIIYLLGRSDLTDGPVLPLGGWGRGGMWIALVYVLSHPGHGSQRRTAKIEGSLSFQHLIQNASPVPKTDGRGPGI